MERTHNHKRDGHHWQDCLGCDDAGTAPPISIPWAGMSELRAALEKAARDMVWTLFVRCQHDSEGHSLPAIERYFVRRWLRAALSSEPRTEPGTGEALREALNWRCPRHDEFMGDCDICIRSAFRIARNLAAEYARLSPDSDWLCPLCGTPGAHYVEGVEGIPDHRISRSLASPDIAPSEEGREALTFSNFAGSGHDQYLCGPECRVKHDSLRAAPALPSVVDITGVDAIERALLRSLREQVEALPGEPTALCDAVERELVLALLASPIPDQPKTAAGENSSPTSTTRGGIAP